MVPASPAAIELLVLHDERLAGGVGDRPVLDVELGGAALSGVVMEREIAIDPVPCAVEADRNALDYIETTVSLDGEQRIEALDANAAVLRPRATCQRGEEEGETRDAAEDLRAL
jgi:hypothetical protein